MQIAAVIFDLDGVIVSTDEQHYRAWKKLADREGIFFDRNVNHRLRGVSRMDSLEIILERAEGSYTEEEKAALAAQKNGEYCRSLAGLTPEDILPGAMAILNGLKELGVRIAIASSSRNARRILEGVGLADFFDAVVDGTEIQRSKPDPEVFVKAAQKLDMPADRCLVVEDAEAGVTAALAAGARVLAVGHASADARATAGRPDLSAITVDAILDLDRDTETQQRKGEQ